MQTPLEIRFNPHGATLNRARLSPLVHARIDKVGAGMSFACAIHCMLMPLVIGVLPLLGLGFLADHTAEAVFVSFSVLLALTSLCWGYRSHGKKYLFAILALSAALIATGIWIVAEDHHTLFVVLGACGITLSHILNKRLCASCSTCTESDHSCCQ